MSQLHAVPTAVTDLEIGMFVTALDRPWIETPFLVEGFYITSQADIDEVEKHCRFVYVDVYRSRLGAGRRNSRVVGGAGFKAATIAPPHEPALETIKFRPRSARAMRQSGRLSTRLSGVKAAAGPARIAHGAGGVGNDRRTARCQS